jgi:hypothetical protein
MTVYQPGDNISVSFTVRDANGTLYDPTTVRFHYTNPAGTLSTKTYGVDGVVTKPSTGLYKLSIFVPYALASVGDWYYDAQALDGSGNSLLVEDGRFTVGSLATVTS